MSKSNKILLAIFLPLLFLAIAYQYWWRDWQVNRLPVPTNPLLSVNWQAVNHIKVKGPQFSGDYRRNNKGWQLEKSKTALKSGMAEKFLASLATAATTSVEIVSVTGDGAEAFGFGESADHLLFYQDQKVIADLYFSSKPALAGGWYLQKSPSATVYYLSGLLDYPGIDWRRQP
jgi:hypothetical protein